MTKVLLLVVVCGPLLCVSFALVRQSGKQLAKAHYSSARADRNLACLLTMRGEHEEAAEFFAQADRLERIGRNLERYGWPTGRQLVTRRSREGK